MTSLNLFITQSPAHKTVGHVVSGQKYLLKKIIFTCPLLYCRMTSNFSEPFQDASKIYLFTNISEMKVRKHTQRGKKYSAARCGYQVHLQGKPFSMMLINQAGG